MPNPAFDKWWTPQQAAAAELYPLDIVARHAFAAGQASTAPTSPSVCDLDCGYWRFLGGFFLCSPACRAAGRSLNPPGRSLNPR